MLIIWTDLYNFHLYYINYIIIHFIIEIINNFSISRTRMNMRRDHVDNLIDIDTIVDIFIIIDIYNIQYLLYLIFLLYLLLLLYHICHFIYLFLYK